MNKEVIIIGAGGHSKVIADIVLKNNDILLGFLDDNLEIGTEIINGYNVIGNLSYTEKENEKQEYIIAIGNNEVRKKIADKYNFKYYTAIHPSAIIGIDTKIDDGAMIMANVVINPNAKIGKHTIINTGAIIEHDNIIEDYVHISPNSTLGGTAVIKERTHVGIGATIKNNITITQKTIVGAGAVVVKDIEEKGTYIGVPAKKIK